VATIPRAVMLLGFSTVRNLALGVKVWDALAAGLSRTRMEALWAHAIAVAVVTKTLAVRLRAGDPDEGFTAGLLHDVGRLVLAMRFRERYWDAVGGAPAGEPVHAIEQASFGVDHAEVGGWMLEAWSLPPAIVDAVRTHHAPELRPGMPGLLAVVNRLVAWTDFASGAVRPEAALVFATVAERGITSEVWREVVGQMRDDRAFAALGRLEA
jgi:putative nucleotidyltransferase with HDIG domain